MIHQIKRLRLNGSGIFAKASTRRSCVNLSLLFAAASLGALTGCATTMPQSVREAESLIGRNTENVQAERGQMVAKAQELLRQAKEAAKAGDMERASLLARQSIQTYNKAVAFSEREQAERMNRALARSRGEAAFDQKKLKELDQRVGKLEQGTAPGAAASRARRAIVKARDQQTAASLIPAAAESPTFAQGQSQLESAVDSYESKSYPEAADAAQAAAASFASALALGKSQGASEQQAGSEQNEAQRALAEAEDARSEAQRKHVQDTRDADDALRAARLAFDSKAYARARDKAIEAKALYRSSGAGPVAALAKVDSGGASSSGLRDIAERTIVELQFRRSEALGQMKDKSCPGVFREFESIVELAQRRFDAQDYARAYGFAVRADERFRACNGAAEIAPVKAGGATATAAKPATDEAKNKAAVQIQKAQVELARAQTVNPSDVGVVQGQMLLRNAESWYEKGEFGEATELARNATTVLAKVGSGTAKPAAGATATSTTEVKAKATKEDAEDAIAEAEEQLRQAPESATKPRAETQLNDAKAAFKLSQWDTAVARANKVVEMLQKAAIDAKCTEAKDLVATARQIDKKLVAAELSADDQKVRRTAQGDLTAAERKVTAKSCEEAWIAASTGHDAIARMAGEPVVAKIAETNGKPSLTTGKPWDAAVKAIAEAEREGELARTRAKSTDELEKVRKADASLEKARGEYQKDDFTGAQKDAEDAKIAYVGIVGKPQAPAAASKEKDKGKAAPAKTEKVLPPDQYAAARVQAAEAEGLKNVDPAWKPAYNRVFEALAMREQAGKDSPNEKAKLADADAKLKSARGAWDGKRYAQAQGFADAAITIMQPLVGKVDNDPALRAKADDVLREAGQLGTVCEQEKCAERDVKKYAAAQADLDAAKRAYGTSRMQVALDSATKARDGFDALLKIPRPAPPTGLTPEQIAKLRVEAEDALRDAAVAKKICDTKSCKERDPEGTIRAVELMASANVANTDGRYELARDRAREVEKIYKTAAANVPVIEINESGVTRSGNQLVLAPKITFANASSAITPASQKSVDALAKVLIANKDAIKRVQLIGYTDNRGAAASNVKLSAARASSLRTALIARGVPGDMLIADGQGPANPIADNKTAAGREENRRVEVTIEPKDGVQ